MSEYLKNIVNEVYRLAGAKLFALAFVRLRILLKELHEWWAIQRCEELETLCGQMLKYSLGDFEDPDRGKIIAQLQVDICELADDIAEAITMHNSQFTLHNSQLMKVDSDRLLNGDIFDIERSQALVDLFRSVWLNGRLKAEDRRELIAFIENENIELTARTLVVSALMLKGLRMYDKSVVMIYMTLLDTVDARLKARIMVGLLMILSVHGSKIERDEEMSAEIEKLFADEKFSADADKAYKHIINTFGTDKVTEKIKTEIYPEIFKSGAKLHQMLKDEGADVMNEDEFNPK